MIGQDRRPHVDNVQDFKVNFDGSNTNWVQARQYERSMRQVFVNIKNEDGTPLDLTGCNVWFEGLLPKNSAGDFRVIDDKGYVALDPTAGRFRFDMPGHAFTVAGSYRQAFFRILKDGNSITTLEFDLDVLADKVIDGLVPRTYISPFEDLYDQLVKILDNADGKLQDKLTEWNNKLQDLFNSLNKMGIETQTLLQTLQGRITTLEEKIKQDDLLTQKDFQAFENVINGKMTDLATSVEAIRQMGRNNAGLLQYKMVSVTIQSNRTDGMGMPTENQLKHLQAIGAEIALIDMLNVNGVHDYNPQRSDGVMLNQSIELIKKIGLKINMLKPHIGLNFGDGFYRGDYAPSDVPSFFDNWKNILLQYAEICKQNDIPILCIGCEQYHQTDKSNDGHWDALTNAIRAKYPNLLLTYALSGPEIRDRHDTICHYLDLIGVNLYPSYLPGDYNGSQTKDDLIPSWAFDTSGDNYYQYVDFLADHYHKNVLITETGVISKTGGLANIIPRHDFDPTVDNLNSSQRDFNVAAVAMQAIFDGICKDKNVIGLAYWHLQAPFHFFDWQADVSNLSVAEKVFQEYVKGGLA